MLLSTKTQMANQILLMSWKTHMTCLISWIFHMTCLNSCWKAWEAQVLFPGDISYLLFNISCYLSGAHRSFFLFTFLNFIFSLFFNSRIPFTRKQDLTNVSYEVKNMRGTKIARNIVIINNHQRFWRYQEGDFTTATDQTFLRFSHFEAPPHVHIKYELDLTYNTRDAKILWSPIKRLAYPLVPIVLQLGCSITRWVAQYSENHLSLCLLNAV